MNNTLTPYELALVSDANILLAKNRIIQTVANFFGQLAAEYKEELAGRLEYDKMVHAKVSRGENYKGLPYVMLDFPRQFSKSEVFAIRSFFWWGNFFSITLQLTGRYQDAYSRVIQNAIDANEFAGWYIGSGTDEWNHSFDNDNYTLIGNGEANISDKPFLKLAKKIPLQQWDEVEGFFIESFKLLIKVLEN